MDDKTKPILSSAVVPHIQPRKLKSDLRRRETPSGLLVFASSLLVAAGAAAMPVTSRAPVTAVVSSSAQGQETSQLRVPDEPPLEFEGGNFMIENSDNGPQLVFERDGQRREVPLMLPPAESLGNPTKVYYGEEYSFILTRNDETGKSYAIITMGAADVAAGRETLPNNDLINADCVLLPSEPISHSFAGDKMFFFYGENMFRILEADTGRLRRLTVQGVSGLSVAVDYEGLYFLIQPNQTPVIFLGRKTDGSYEAQAFDYNASELTGLVRYEETEGRLSAFFLNSGGQTIEIGITVGEEGNLGTVRIEGR